jgi:hypothetical protein
MTQFAGEGQLAFRQDRFHWDIAEATIARTQQVVFSFMGTMPTLAAGMVAWKNISWPRNHGYDTSQSPRLASVFEAFYRAAHSTRFRADDAKGFPDAIRPAGALLV